MQMLAFHIDVCQYGPMARTAVALGSPAATCCSAGLDAPLDRDAAEELATLLKAVADPTRLQLLAFIRNREDAEACVCDLSDAVGLSQPTVSHHLKVLVDAGILTRSKRGYWAWYTVVPERLAELAGLLR